MSASLFFDVAVVGAGPAGVAAAAAAAGAGARVVLIEAAERLGGTVTAGLHRALCGLYAGGGGGPESPLHTLNEGVQRELVARMVARDPHGVVPRQMGQVWVLEFPLAAWEAALADLCAEAPVTVRRSTPVTEVRRAGRRVVALHLGGAAAAWVGVRTVVDGTGDGNILQMAGPDVLLPEIRTPRILGGFAVRLGGITGDLEALRLEIPYVLARAAEAGQLPPAARFTLFHPGPGSGEGVCKLAVPPEDFAPERAEPWVERIVHHLMTEIPALSAARVLERSPRVLPRDGRHLRGRYILSESDILTPLRHGSGAIRAWWPIERWDVVTGPTYAYPPAGEAYEIPDEALQSAVLDNLLTAGNCLSATPLAAASARAAGICLATGDAAGRLAAGLCPRRP
jgi:hypothetical protein